MQPTPTKQAIVGALLTFSLPESDRYKLATWYRVMEQDRKIVKMHTIKEIGNLAYRCTVFDLGALIELRIEKVDEEEVRPFGPVKFDPYLTRQLDCKNNVWFSVNIHVGINETLQARMRNSSNEDGQLQVHLQTKQQKNIVFRIPMKEDWRGYEKIFVIKDTKLTDICIRGIQNQAIFRSKLLALNIVTETRSYLLITFANVVQRNLFIAQIIMRSKNFSEKPRNSQLKSITNSQNKNPIENQFDDLFKSNIHQKSARISEKTYNDMKQVVFTPIMDLQDEQAIENAFNSVNFNNFLNPEDNKQQRKQQKLSSIAEDQSQIRDRSSRNIHNSPTEQPQKKLDFLEKLKIKSKQKQKFNKWSQITTQNKKLKQQNRRLKKQNQQLRKKLTRSKTLQQIRYSIPQFIKNQLKNNHRLPAPISYRSKPNQRSNREKTREFSSSQGSSMVVKNLLQKFRRSHASQKESQQWMKKRMVKTVSHSTKQIKRFLISAISSTH